MTDETFVPEPTLTPEQQIAGLHMLWRLRDLVIHLTGPAKYRGRAKHARLQLYGLLGDVDDATMERARRQYVDLDS